MPKQKTKPGVCVGSGRPVEGPRGRVTRHYWGRRARHRGEPLQSLELNVKVGTWPTTALVDSGATHSFISAAFVQLSRISTRRAERPLIVTLATGVEVVAGRVAEVEITFPGPQSLTQRQLCHVIPELHSPILLGYDWLAKHNPRINWKQAVISLPADADEFVAVPSKRQRQGCNFLLPAESLESMLRCPKTRDGLRMWSVQGKPRAAKGGSEAAILNISATAHGYRCRDPEVYALLNRFIGDQKYSVDACIEAALVALNAGRILDSIVCTKCSSPHLDMHAKALELHVVHQCNACGHEWQHPGASIQANPLAQFGLRVVGSELYCDRLPAAESVGLQAGEAKFADVLDGFPTVFSDPGQPQKRALEFEIKLKDPGAQIPKHRLYRMSPFELAECQKQIEELLAKGWIRESTSAYGHPLLFVKKKDGTMRMCVDYRGLNQNTVVDKYPIPRIDDLLDRLQGAKVFSAIDLRAGYHQMSIKESDRHYTAFISRWGLYEYCVLPFGLVNAPSAFQRLMNTVLRGALDEFCMVYLDDILVFSANEADHRKHLHWVFSRLREHGLHVKRSKCRFGVSELQYLGHLITEQGVKPDPEKVRVIKTWPEPSNVREIQSFLGLANYYSQYIPAYARLALPLTSLCRKNVPWQWTDVERSAFAAIRDSLCSSPLLLLPDLRAGKEFVLETDASEQAVGAVLQQDQGRGLQPVLYLSHKLTGAECNYPTHEKELLAIVLAVKKLRPYLDGRTTRVITDHRTLVNFYKQPHLSKRQIRWLETLSETKLQIEYRPGQQAVVPDALSRAPHVAAQPTTGFEDAASVDFARAQMLARTSTRMQKAFLMFSGGSLHIPSRLCSIVVEPTFLARVSQAQHDPTDLEMAPLLALAHSNDPLYRVVTRFGVPLLYRCEAGKAQQLVLPDASGLRRSLMLEMHCAPSGGHFGVKKTMHLLSQRVWWPRMRASVASFIAGCDVCQTTKSSTQKPPGLMAPLPVPSRRFGSWSMDFITDLPQKGGYNAIFTCVDRMSKLVRVCPCKVGENALTAQETAWLFFQQVVRHHGVPDDVVHDRDVRFTSGFWKSLMGHLGTRCVFSTAHHPQTDGQTERTHRSLQQVLRALVRTHQSDDWPKLLPIAEFALNATPNASTGTTPFAIVYGSDNAIHLPIDRALQNNETIPAAEDVAAQVTEIVSRVREQMLKAQEAQKRQYDKKRRDVQFSVGDRVLLSTDHLRLSGSRKLNPKWIGPYTIVERIGDLAYRLALPSNMRLHPVFNVTRLKAYVEGGGDGTAPPPPVMEDGSEPEYEISHIVAQRGAGRRTQYRVRWTGYGPEEDRWLNARQLENAQDVLADWLSKQV